jgi:hypothetical protein
MALEAAARVPADNMRSRCSKLRRTRSISYTRHVQLGIIMCYLHKSLASRVASCTELPICVRPRDIRSARTSLLTSTSVLSAFRGNCLRSKKVLPLGVGNPDADRLGAGRCDARPRAGFRNRPSTRAWSKLTSLGRHVLGALLKQPVHGQDGLYASREFSLPK